jgi:hypothetical protein
MRLLKHVLVTCQRCTYLSGALGFAGIVWDALPFDDAALLFLSITPLFLARQQWYV